MLRMASTEPGDEDGQQQLRRLRWLAMETPLERELREQRELTERQHGGALPRSPLGSVGSVPTSPWRFAQQQPTSPQKAAAKRAAGGEEAPAEVRLQVGEPGGRRMEELSKIAPLPEHKRVTIHINRVCAHVPLHMGQQPSFLAKLKRAVRGSQPSSGDSTRGGTHRQVLYDVSGSVLPGELLALMGPSGSGKTSLLSILGGRAQKAMQVAGSCTFNGKPLTKAVKRRVGYVLQDDLLYEQLTVQETLHYAAFLRLPREMGRAEKLGRIDTVVAALGLGDCRETIIGGFMRKGISGGERKRCSIGVEMLIDPSVIMLDEPTSGLDASTSMHVLSMLRHLAGGGRAVIATIHQPSSRLYQQLDKLLLLSQGHVMYYGAAAAADQWFAGMGYPLPYGQSLADFVLDLANGDVATDDRDGEETRTYLVGQSEAYLSRRPLDGFAPGQSPTADPSHGIALKDVPLGAKSARGLPAVADSAATLGSSSGGGSGSEEGSPMHGRMVGAGLDGITVLDARPSKGLASSSASGLLTEHRWGASFGTQISLLFRRSLKTRRFESMDTQDIVQFLLIAVLAGLFWLQVGQDASLIGARNTLGFLFFILLFTSFKALFSALFTFPDEYKHMLKERASGMYRLSAFFVARTLSDLPMSLALPSMFLVIVYWMAGLRYNAAAFFGIWGVVLLSILVAQSIGLLLGVATMNPKTAQTIASVTMMIMVLTGGFFVVDLPAWLGWMKYVSYVFYALQILLFIEFDGGARTAYSCTNPAAADVCAQTSPASPEANPYCIPVDNLQHSLALPQDPSSQSDALRNAFILIAFVVVLRIAVYVVLRRKTSRM